MALQENVEAIAFKSVQLFKDQPLGIGSYGAVCKAKCDDLVCAAKIIHPTLYDPMAQLQISLQREHRLPMRRFEQECEFLSATRHPNIVLHLGMHRDEDTGLPVLLMELMDDNLTHYLESSTQPIPYHIQVNLCHDIALALSFLHSNKVVHRDLSSNNVLLRGNILAKVTDFGMARLGDINPQATRFTSTMCPGTDVYMPPEAVKDKPVYTEKMDCFSFGVVTLQILTRLFPKPGDRMQEMQLNHPGLPPGRVMIQVPEINRRRSHIDKVAPNHPLLPVALDCLKDEDSQRPSAEQLCERTASLKETTGYINARDRTTDRQVEVTTEQVQVLIASRDQQLSDCREEIQRLSQDNEHLRQDTQRLERDHQRLERDHQQLEENNQRLERDNQRLEEDNQRLERDHQRLEGDNQRLEGDNQRLEGDNQRLEGDNQRLERENQRLEEDNQRLEGDNQRLEGDNQRLEEDNQRLERDNQRLEEDNQRLEGERNIQLQEKESQLNRVNHQLEESERVVADFERRIIELEGQLHQRDQPLIQHHDDGEVVIKLRWREGEKAPCKMDRCCDAAVGGNVVYCTEKASAMGGDIIHAYDTTTSSWSLTPPCPIHKGFALAVINETLTTVGGYGLDTKDTNKLFTLTDAGEDGKKSWNEEFPPMPTKRYDVSALCIRTALIVVGGKKENNMDLKTVQILNTSTRQWHTATDLPHPLSCSSLTVCGDCIYLLGERDKDMKWIHSVYSCSLTALLLSIRSGLFGARSRSSSSDRWTRVAELPVVRSTAVSLRGQLIAVGGMDPHGQHTTDIHRYSPSTNSWEVISHMATPRSLCLAAVLPDNQLMVVGGRIYDNKITNSVEFGIHPS